MKCATSLSRLARHSPLRTWIARASVLVVFAVSALMPAACGDSSAPNGTLPVTPDTSTLAGIWKGTVDGSGGRAVLTTYLNADSTYSGIGDVAFYCLVTGKWTVSGGIYTSTGRNCIGNIVT